MYALTDTVTLKNSLKMPRFGMGMWCIGERSDTSREERQAIQSALNMGVSLIDTAEMYGSGRSESFIGEVIQGYERSRLFIVSKVLPSNVAKGRIRTALENSLKRLKTSYLDCYLYHWIGSTPFEEVVFGMEELVKDGLIRSWGVSNFDTADLQDLIENSGGQNCVINQVLYNLASRGIEFSLLPYMQEKRVIPMAYCPLALGGTLCHGLMEHRLLKQLADKHHASVAQILLAFVLHKKEMVAIPRSCSLKHTLENLEAVKIELDSADLAMINQNFPAPDYKTPLEVV